MQHVTSEQRHALRRAYAGLYVETIEARASELCEQQGYSVTRALRRAKREALRLDYRAQLQFSPEHTLGARWRAWRRVRRDQAFHFNLVKS